MEKELIHLEHVSKTYDGHKVLDGLDLAISENEFVTLLGPSGCGKTTTLRLIAGFETPDEGRILFEGADITQLPPNRRQVNTVFQNYSLFSHMDVAENIAFGPKIHGKSRDYIRDKIRYALKLVNLDGYEHANIVDLSGGQQQRVAIARAVASNPKLLLLDEPLSNLDARLRIDMRSELQRIHKELGTTVIYVTHDQVEALTMSTKIALFKAGELSQVATPMELYMNPIDLQAADFIGNPRINFLEGTAEMKGGALHVTSELGEHVFDKADMTDELIPDGAFPCVVAIRPEQIHISRQNGPGRIAVQVYANQPAGSETLVSLRAGKSDFLAKQIGLSTYAIDENVFVEIPAEKINIYDAKSTRLIKRAR